MALKERRGQDIVMTVSKASDASGDGTVALTLTLAFCSRLEALPSCAGYINTQNAPQCVDLLSVFFNNI